MSSAATEPMPVLDSLRAGLRGRLLTAADGEYDAARVVVAGHVDAHPLAIARVRDASDVAHVIDVARENRLEVAVRCGGHDGAGHSTVEGGIVIDLRDMKGLLIDAQARTAWAEAGLTALEVVSAAAGHGLVLGFGDTGSVGIGGITLGGGVGYQVRKHGLTIDNLLAAEIVTADGQLLHVDEANHPDLFWAIRGGGGNFGVATRFKYRLHELEGFLGGILVLPATPQTVSGFMRASAEAPEQLSTIANVMNCPPMPFVPEEYHGSLVILAMVGWSGDEADGERGLAPFRALAEPIADLVRPMPYPEMFPVEEGDYRPTAVGRAMFLDRVDETTATAIIDALAASDAPMRAVQLRALGGAMARVAPDATAFAHRHAKVMAIVVSFYEGADDRPARAAWVADLAAAIDQGVYGVYVNFLDQEGPERVREAYPGTTWERLRQVKARYDPENVFHRNQNVPPAE